MKKYLVVSVLMFVIVSWSMAMFEVPSVSDMAAKTIIADIYPYEPSPKLLGTSIDTTGLIWSGINFDQSYGYWGGFGQNNNDADDDSNGWQPTLSYWLFIKYNENAKYFKKWGIAVATPETDIFETFAVNAGVEVSALNTWLNSAEDWQIPVLSNLLTFLGEQGTATISGGIGYGHSELKWDILLGYKVFLDKQEKIATMQMSRQR